jgi:rhodanese-related sulfurtransferase
MKTIRPTELQQLFLTEPALALVDVRTPVEFAEVHAIGARNVPLDKFEPRQMVSTGVVAREQPVYLLCRSGGRAKQAAEKMAQQGLDQGVVVEGGTQAWVAAGLPVERGEVKVISLERQVRIVAGAMVLAGLLLGYFVHPYFIGLSAFVGVGLIFAGITDWCGMGLLLAKAPWNSRAS